MKLSDLEIVDIQANSNARKQSRSFNVSKNGVFAFSKQATVDLQLKAGQKWTIAIDPTTKQAYFLESDKGCKMRISTEERATFNSIYLSNLMKDKFDIPLPNSMLIGICEQTEGTDVKIWPIISTSAKQKNIYDKI
ncbi:MAG: hypothetical protein N4A41_00495 [Crocinitomicaceae bacterium]|jgi:hypothetical protein|nr:hypothetical protein [Crocinitomicaceae bacterium]